MQTTPWALQRTKRKQSVTTPGPRKRVRISDGDTIKKPKSASSSFNQRTLTQIDWVQNASPSFEDETNSGDVYGKQNAKPKRQKLGAKTPNGRKSTLTQMGWFGGSRRDPEQVRDLLEDTALLSEQELQREVVIPQNDGHNDRRVAGRRQKPPVMKKTSDTSSFINCEYETQEYKPPSKQSKEPKIKGEFLKARRKSVRLAQRTSPSSQKSTKTSDARQTSPYQQITELASKPGILEIKDSASSDDDQVLTRFRKVPQTPPRRFEIPSSQTPETIMRCNLITPSTKRFTTRRTERTPLGEKPVNIITRSRFGAKIDLESSRTNVEESPMRKKVCMLKSPEHEPPISSEEATNGSKKLLPQSQSPPPSGGMKSPALIRTGSGLGREARQTLSSPRFTKRSIPRSRSHSNSGHSMPSSPPGITINESATDSESQSISKESETPSKDIVRSSQADEEELEDVPVFTPRRSARTSNDGQTIQTQAKFKLVADDEMLLGSEDPKPVCFELPACRNAVIEEDSDLGSPVANDTQFNIGLVERTSSPAFELSTKHEFKVPQKHKQTLPNTSPQYQDVAVVAGNEDIDLDAVILAPTMRPMRKTSPLLSRQSIETGYQLAANISSSSLTRSKNSHPGEKVPLSDTDSTMHSSSPSLPRSISGIRQSVRPAAIPRPSQESTQEPTQYHMLSSMPHSTPWQASADSITIKDSSPVHLSQIPQHDSQAHGLGLAAVEESDDGEDDLDLDPSTATENRQSARKPSTLCRKDTGSSLRSIHRVSSKSSINEPQTNLSSSPILQSKTPCRSRLQDHHVQAADVSPPPRSIQNNLFNQYDTSNPTLEKPLPSSPPPPPPPPPSSSSPISSPGPPPLKRKYSPIPGFDNETQSNFTQNGHVTAAYIHRQRETGDWPDWFVPQPFQVANYRRKDDDDDDDDDGGGGGGRKVKRRRKGWFRGMENHI